MPITQRDIKLLWGRAANRCSICKTELSIDGSNASFPIGEQAHIVGEKEDAARGKSNLPIEDRNSYTNIILLCPNHHTEIDKNEADWSIEKLYTAKINHELWVQQTLAEYSDSKKVVAETICASIIDKTVQQCRLDDWNNWTFGALSADSQWPIDLPDQFARYCQDIVAAVWPAGFDELKRATTTLAFSVHHAAQVFLEHAIQRGDTYWCYRFYRGDGWNPNYDRDVRLFEEWQSECQKHIYLSTKAANWFADVVRRDINPLFFAVKGKFVVTEGPDFNLKINTRLLEFTEEEKQRYPDCLFSP